MKTTGLLIRFFVCLVALSYTGITINAQSIKTVPLSSTITTDLNQDGSEKLELYVSAEWPVSSYNAVITEKMQKAIIHNMSSMLDGWGVSPSQITTSNLTQAIYSYNELLVENFKDWLGDGANGADISLTGRFSHYHKSFACCTFGLWYWVNHCAHPNTFVQHLVLDTKTGDVVTLDDIFRTGYQTALKNILDLQPIRLYKDDEIVDKTGWERDYYTLTDNFCVNSKGIVFFYNNESHAVGTTSYIYIPWHKISHLLK